MSIHPTARHSAVRSLLRGGFTLIEVIAAMALMTFVIGGVYGIANGAMELGRSMSENRIHETRITNFVTAWREYLENLPPETRITVGEKPSRKFGKGSLLVENGSVPFAWTQNVRLAEAVEFKLERSLSNRNAMTLHVLHLKEKKRATSADDYEVLADLPLLTDAMLRSGEVTLVNFWASWCPPCRAEHPLVEALAAEGIPVYGINYRDDPARALEFLEDLGNPYAAIGADPRARMGLDWGVVGLPETFVLDGRGNVVMRHAGPLTDEVLATRLRPAMARAAGH